MNREPEASGARLLFTDAKVALLLAAEARNRMTAQLFGVTPDQSALVSVIAIGLVAAAAQKKASAVMGARPTTADTLIGASVVNVALHGIAGSPASDTRFLGTLITFALVANSFGPTVARSIRGLRVEGRRVGSAIRGRYGADRSANSPHRLRVS